MIKKLSSNLINQIAAGEVVDDPKSIIKELLENSIDANSKNIEIILHDGGLSKIIINDDGIGISKSDLPQAFERFATSKLENLKGLSNINTLGFRGEALPSIASISEITLKSKTSKDVGNEIKFSFGKQISLKPSNIEEGTSIEIKNIFNNVPARKKFLKSENYEYRKILNLFKRFALCNYNISFKLINNGKVIYDLQKVNLKSRINSLFTIDIEKSLINISYKKDNYQVSGYIGNLSLVKTSRGNQFLYVNNRHINNLLINTSIYTSYRSLIARGEYPFFVLFLSIHNSLLDINVHPKKEEVRFTNELQIQHIFKKSITTALKDISHTIPNYNNINFADELNIEELPFNSSLTKNDEILSMTDNKNFHDNIKNAEFRLMKIKDDNFVLEKNNIWQIHNKYIITEILSGLIIIDQHVAHERVLYESSKRALEGDGMTSQKLLFPTIIEFDAEEYSYLLEIIYYLKKIGFDLREFGDNKVIIEGAPNNLPIGKEEETIQEIIGQYTKTSNANSAFIEYMASTYACKAAIKAGDKLTSKECIKLVDELFSTEHPYYCPHGRPIIVNLSIDDLDKRFERH